MLPAPMPLTPSSAVCTWAGEASQGMSWPVRGVLVSVPEVAAAERVMVPATLSIEEIVVSLGMPVPVITWPTAKAPELVVTLVRTFELVLRTPEPTPPVVWPLKRRANLPPVVVPPSVTLCTSSVPGTSPGSPGKTTSQPKARMKLPEAS